MGELPAFEIVKLTDVPDWRSAEWLDRGMHAVFREAADHYPTDPQAAAAFDQLWLDSYLRAEPELVFVALRGSPSDASIEADVAGYLVASRRNPLSDPQFAELGYFRDFAPHLAAYPAHLHINVRADIRGRGAGRLLIEAAADELARRGVAGVHIVTASSARNTTFYRRAGFIEQGQSDWKGRHRVLMGRKLLLPLPVRGV